MLCYKIGNYFGHFQKFECISLPPITKVCVDIRPLHVIFWDHQCVQKLCKFRLQIHARSSLFARKKFWKGLDLPYGQNSLPKENFDWIFSFGKSCKVTTPLQSDDRISNLPFLLEPPKRPWGEKVFK